MGWLLLSCLSCWISLNSGAKRSPVIAVTARDYKRPKISLLYAAENITANQMYTPVRDVCRSPITPGYVILQ